MKTIAEIRLDNLERLIAEFGTQENVAQKSGTSSVYLSQIRNKTPDAKTGKLRQMGDLMARKIEAGCEKETGWMDNVPNPNVTADFIYTVTQGDGSTAVIAAEAKAPIAFPQRGSQHDVWMQAALEILHKLDSGQRQAMVSRMREYTQFLDPPRVGQAL